MKKSLAWFFQKYELALLKKLRKLPVCMFCGKQSDVQTLEMNARRSVWPDAWNSISALLSQGRVSSGGRRPGTSAPQLPTGLVGSLPAPTCSLIPRLVTAVTRPTLRDWLFRLTSFPDKVISEQLLVYLLETGGVSVFPCVVGYHQV